MERLGSLPPMSAEIKLDSIEKAVKANLTFKGEWTTFYWSKFFFRSPIVVHMISDLFWWASLEFFNQSDGNEPLPADCYAHVAQAYVEHQVASAQNRKLRHGPKPNLIVRDVLDEFTMQEEEIPSDDSNDADFLSEDEASNGMAAYDMNDDAGSSEEMVHQRLQLPPASAPGRSKVSLKFSPSVDKQLKLGNHRRRGPPQPSLLQPMKQPHDETKPLRKDS
ncbi:hypothetical protein DYB28_001340 [Aphanomyces astaci]|uniref:Uncharacterized protein n=1 Tax=Aphanomyces astaci TaxID=112090 RepID=A0A397ENW5_APHAT|nr:hypothetical protein DYB36_002385 [Aphanomyces astaci]RHY35870.1 hypothetical protein DYB38_001051 [Aphanomyces astaci]RHY50580.1 hypothetical protein DYB34_002621 [Aphanomyces astaci]RHY98703.1 hypothetical protein DYB31_006500 [Aphanomyces astaci]RLN99475.1 hypothetical protein DYB28_001340 [Aphanomyces astaci]